jgi:SAM-dependent methyltransferase
MTSVSDRPSFDRAFWDTRWTEVLRDHPDQIAQRQPSAYVTDLLGDRAPARALDAGCGNGAEAMWLASRGWRVTAVDFSAAALEAGRSAVAALGSDTERRIEWIEADLGEWTPPMSAYDVVLSLYVHVSGSVEAMVARLASGVAPGGTLLLVGHLPIDPTTGTPSPAAGQVQVTVDAAAAALDPAEWDINARTQPRAVAGSGHDAVICATRR